MHLVKILTAESQHNYYVYKLIEDFFDLLKNNEWIKYYIFWELKLFKVLGYDLEFKTLVDKKTMTPQVSVDDLFLDKIVPTIDVAWHKDQNRFQQLLEKDEDKNLVWRKYVNKKLKTEYKTLFSTIDHFIFIKIPNFKMVYKWRFLQEKKLRKKFYASKKIMNSNQIKRFIMFYQRITLQMMKDLSKSASVVFLLKKNHEVKKILFKS